MDIKKIELYRNDDDSYSTSEAAIDDLGGTYYQSVDVDEHIKKLAEAHAKRVKQLESEVEYSEEQRDDAINITVTLEDERDTLRQLLLPALKVLESISANSGQEVTYNGKITDVAGLVSDIKWQMKGPVESSDSVIG